MRVILKRVFSKDKENWKTVMECNTKDSGVLTNPKDLELSCGRTNLLIRDNIIKVLSKDKAYTNGMMAPITKENGTTMKYTDTENTHGKMVPSIWVISNTINERAMER